ncbi:MAG: 50S ribosomal protein L6 [Lysobacterales bacterium]
MSRVAKKPVSLPEGVECRTDAGAVVVKGPKGTLQMHVPDGIDISIASGELQVASHATGSTRVAGTTRALLANMVKGVSEGYSRKLELVGVGFRAAMQGKDLTLNLGFSHPVVFSAPAGVTLEAPAQTEILVKGADKQQVGEVAAKIRAHRPPEPYKGKGVRYSGEKVTLKEAKKA